VGLFTITKSNKENRIHKKAKKTNTIGQWEKFRNIRNKCNKLILNAKQSYFDIIAENLTRRQTEVKIGGI
jgi:hypothetical protein